MPPTPKCHTVTSEISEPPSRRSQCAVVEAAIASAIDGNLYTFFSLLCGNIRFPILALFFSYMFVFMLLIPCGLSGINSFFDFLLYSDSQSFGVFAGILLQGIGYGAIEIIHTKSSKLFSPLKKYCDAYITSIIKNSIFIGVIALIHIFSRGFVHDIFHGAIYGITMLTLQEVFFRHPVLRKLLGHITRLFLSVFSLVKTSFSLTSKMSFCGSLTMIALVISGSLYAGNNILVHSSMYITALISCISILQQAVVYEYAYRATYAGYQQSAKHCKKIVVLLKNSIDEYNTSHISRTSY